MAKLTIMQGLPASGKSTKVQELMKADGNAVRINKDLLRKMLHFNKWSGKNEGLTREAARILAREFLLQGKNVIIDDTNLNEGTMQSWLDLAKMTLGTKVQTVKMDTPIEECIKRDAGRLDSVGRSVIVNMALLNGIYPKPAKGFVICDLDGTLCDISHRLHYVKPGKLVEISSMKDGSMEPGFKKDWRGFFAGIPDDKVRTEVLDMLLKYEGMGHEIILVSARPDDHREATEVWLKKAFKGYPLAKTLIMRRAGDSRDDTIVKQEIYDNYFKKHDYPILCVIDDRPSVIRMWRSNGLKVIDVGAGVEF